MRKFGETFDNRYFFCYILLWIFITVEDFIDIDLAFIKDAIETAKTTVQCASFVLLGNHSPVSNCSRN